MSTASLPAGTVDYSPQPAKRSLRLWPAVLILALMWLLSRLPGWVAPVTMYQFMGLMWVPLLAAVALFIWWFTRSSLRWSQRLLIPAVIILGGVLAAVIGHPSIRMPLILFTFPLVLTVWIAALLLTSSRPWPTRRTAVIAGILLTWGAFTLLRMDGLGGDLSANLVFRWSGTPEERFMAKRSIPLATSRPTTAASTTLLTLSADDWPAFRGPNRDSHATGQRIRTDWDKRPPKQVWRRLIGPGWSSFAVVGDRLFTQEQRGQVEATVCYDAPTGNEVWVHEDRTRFEEALAGPGPRATPTFWEGKLYALGANGHLNCLDPATGSVLWTRDVRADSGAAVPQWGFSSSPLISHGIVSVVAGGPGGKAVMAYDAPTGKPAWSAGDGFSYASMHPAHIGGVDQVMLVTAEGATALDPEKGTKIWQHRWPIDPNMNRVVQPTILDDASFLLGTSFGFGTQRVKVTRDGTQWKDAEAWTSRQLKPYYNDLVVFNNNIYGFDNALFACVSLADGKPLWRVRGYGNGQVLLLPDQGLLLVLTEQGEVALVQAAPDAHHELAKFQAINGKTWNHPVLVRGRLYVRNGEEAACYDVAE